MVTATLVTGGDLGEYIGVLGGRVVSAVIALIANFAVAAFASLARRRCLLAGLQCCTDQSILFIDYRDACEALRRMKWKDTFWNAKEGFGDENCAVRLPIVDHGLGSNRIRQRAFLAAPTTGSHCRGA
jgi:hypothetical protein